MQFRFKVYFSQMNCMQRHKTSSTINVQRSNYGAENFQRRPVSAHPTFTFLLPIIHQSTSNKVQVNKYVVITRIKTCLQVCIERKLMAYLRLRNDNSHIKCSLRLLSGSIFYDNMLMLN